MTPKQAGIKAASMARTVDILYDRIDKLIVRTSRSVAPIGVGAIISTRDSSHRLHYFNVHKIDGVLRGRVISWYADAFRCNKDGKRRGGSKRFTASSRFDIIQQ